jgi:3-oxoacyl-[acyl-carrier-protein] synthase II
VNSDATDFVLPLSERQNECIRGALARAARRTRRGRRRLQPRDLDAARRRAGGEALRAVLRRLARTHVNNTKSFIGHAMGAAAAPSSWPGTCRRSRTAGCTRRSTSRLDPACEVRNLVANEPKRLGRIDTILNLSFGMLGQSTRRSSCGRPRA